MNPDEYFDAEFAGVEEFEDIELADPGSLHVLFDNGMTLVLEDMDESDGIWWCDWLEGEVNEMNTDGSTGWQALNRDRVVAMEWVRIGSVPKWDLLV